MNTFASSFSNPAEDLKLLLTALQAILPLIASIRAQSGMTDAEILLHAQTVTAGNEAQYQGLVAALGLTPPAV